MCQYLKEMDLFSNGQNLSFDVFKKTFFPQFACVDQNQEEEEIAKEKYEKRYASTHKKENTTLRVAERMKKLEQHLKIKFAGNWNSVRKAFLDLDTDYDGYITVEDILRYFASESKELQFNDLKTLMIEKDSKKQGKLGFSDFSKWFGNSIHQSEGFYFRHDSILNP